MGLVGQRRGVRARAGHIDREAVVTPDRKPTLSSPTPNFQG